MAFKNSIPNLLGVFRIVTTPLLMWLILQGSYASYLWATLLLLAMVISDLLDGYLARRMRVVSKLGIFLDTISDKICVTGVLIPLVQDGLLSGWVALVIIVREFLVSGLRSFAAAEGVVISAGKLGKQKFAITMAALVWRLLAASAEVGSGPLSTNEYLRTFLDLWPIAMAAAVLWTILSAADYIWKAMPLLRRAWVPMQQAPTPPQEVEK
jgi:CDP-diacylglycerol--glycerol-3-phosphate 3-phosphatidyltransferase